MLTLEKPKTKVLFVCPAGYELVLVMKSEDFVAVEGRAIKVHPRRINFRKMPFGGSWRGEYLTDKEEEIDFIRQHEWFIPGPIPESEMGPVMISDGKGGWVAREGKASGTTRRIYEADYNPDQPRVLPKIVKRMGDKEDFPPQITERTPEVSQPQPTRAKISKSLRRNRG